jgi:glyoxylase-like metal-dependent hydrolase (beta-lactamase superfamily II)
MLQIETFTFNALSENTYVVYDDTKECVVIDPGCFSRDEQNEISGFIESEKLLVKYLLNTHCHVDHVLGNYYIKDKYKVPLLIHKDDAPVLKAVKVYAPLYGFEGYTEAEPDHFISEGEELKFGSTTFKILFLPGHSPGHVGFYQEEKKIILSGDVLFDSSIGRTDLPGGNYETLMQSIQQKLFSLPSEVIVYPGHGIPTTIGKEKVSNPFCALSLS